MDASLPNAASLGVAFAAIGAVVVLLAVRLRAPGWLLLVVACLPVVALLLDDDFRIVSYHGWLHTSIVYRIQAGEWPPLDPLFAGAELLYPWLHHALVARISSWLDCSPPLVFAAINVGALAATAWAWFALAMAVFRDRATAVVGSALGLYGLAALPFAIVLQSATAVELESRLIPFQKFTNINSNSLGILCFALGLLALVRLQLEPRARAPVVWLGVALLAGALLYPLTWAALVGVAVAALSIGWWAEPATRGRAAAALAVVVGTSALAAPYLLSIQLGRGDAAGIVLATSAGHWGRNVANWLLVGGGWAVLGWFVRADWWTIGVRHPGVVVVLGTAAVATSGAFLLLHSPVHTEYKFVMLAGMTLSLAGARAAARLLERSQVAGVLLLWVLLLPAGAFFSQVALGDFHSADEPFTSGRLLESSDPDARQLHAWIREHTPADAAFIDLELSIPVFGQRAVWVAMEPGDDRAGGLRGWGLSPQVFLLEVMGHDPERVERRRRATAALLAPGPAATPPGVVRALVDDAPAGRTFAVARHPQAVRRLRGDPHFEEVFSNRAATVFRWVAP